MALVLFREVGDIALFFLSRSCWLEMLDMLLPFLSFSSIIDLRSSSWSSLCIRFVMIASFLMVSFDLESLLLSKEGWYIELIDSLSSIRL